MPRFVILEHDWPERHWDFLLEAGDVLRAWRLLDEPRSGATLQAEVNFDHRRLYLDYEGPLSGNRGSVKQWDTGNFEWLANEGGRVVVNLTGRSLVGQFTLMQDGERWMGMLESNPLSVAFKEWAVICRALAEGRQTLILRKGGIAEAGGQFRPEHDRFLLYPTYFHEQHRTGIKPEFMPLLDAAENEKPMAGTMRFSHFAVVESVQQLTDLKQVQGLEPFHAWTAEETEKRFRYRTPGLYLFAVRVHRLASSSEVIEKPAYAGCKTWVNLDQAVAIEGSTPVLDDAAFARQSEEIKSALARG